MKTLILNGSPREKGDTAFLIKALRTRLKGETIEISAYRANISPCVDCRYCVTHSGCSIDDDMTEIYRALRDCDSVVLASPLFFSEVTGRVLDVGSRLQTLYCARAFRGEVPDICAKKGGIILTGGGDGSPQKAISTATTLLHHMGCKEIFRPVMSLKTNTLPAASDTQAMAEIRALAAFLQGQ